MYFSRDVVAEIGVSSHGVMASRVRELIEQLLVEYVPGHAWVMDLGGINGALTSGMAAAKLLFWGGEVWSVDMKQGQYGWGLGRTRWHTGIAALEWFQWRIVGESMGKNIPP